MKENRNSIVFGAVVLAFVAGALLSYQYVRAGDVDDGEVKAKSKKVELNDRIDYDENGNLKANAHALGDEEEKYASHYDIVGDNLVTTSQRLTPPDNMDFAPVGTINGQTTYVDIYKNVEDLPPVRILDSSGEVKVQTKSPWTNAANYPLRAEGNLCSPGEGQMPHWSIKTLNLTRVDIDADTDNDSTMPHREPSESDPEDAVEYNTDDYDVFPGIVIGVNDDHDEYLPEVESSWDRDLKYHESNALRTTKDVMRDENYNTCVEPIDLRVKVNNPLKNGKFRFVHIPSEIRVFHWSTKLKISNDTLFEIPAGSSWDKTFYLEGVEEACVDLEGAFCVTPGYNKNVAFDIVRITSVKVDLDVDSNNNDEEDYDDEEDLMEIMPSVMGMLVPIDETPDDNDPPVADLKKGVIHKLHEIWEIIIEYAGLNPVIKLKKIHGSGDVRVYKANGTLILDTTVADDESDNLYETLKGGGINLRVRGLVKGEVVLVLEATILNLIKIHVDKIKINSGVDLDIDSDNANGLEESVEEDKIEDDDTKPGKYITVNDDDDDNDGIPDYADGYNLKSYGGNYATATTGESFTPLVLKLARDMDLTKAKIKITYEASDPATVTRAGTSPNYTYAPASGKLRIWTKNGNVVRKPASIGAATPGDYVPNGTFEVSKLGLTGTTRKKILYLEGISPSASSGSSQIQVEVDPDGDGPIGFVLIDAVRLTILKVDADVDSDNNKGFNAPDRNAVEDHYEDVSGDADRPGKFVPVNDNDDDNDGIPDFADGYNLKSYGGNYATATTGEKFTPFVLELPEPIDLTKAKIKVTYEASNPATVTRAGTSPNYTYAPASGKLRIWTKNGNVVRKPASIGAATPGDYVPNDTFAASKFGLTGSTRVKTLYLEGISPSASIASSRIKIEVDPDGDGPADFVLIDAVRLTILKVDADVDSDNNKGFNAPDRNAVEDHYEDVSGDADRPGKFVPVNDDDDDNDGIPDFADGYNLKSYGGNYATATTGEKFTPFVLELPSPIDLAKAKIKITYEASDPATVTRAGTSPNYTYAPASGKLRIWTKNGNVVRKPASIGAATPGDYVPNGTFAASKFGLTGSTRAKTLYLEGISPSASIASSRIKIEVDPDGDGSADFVLVDAVRLTILKVDADVDSDNNKGFNAPDRNAVEDHYEDKSGDNTRPGKFVVVNDNDDDKDAIPDFADGYNLKSYGGTHATATTNEKFTPFVLELPSPIDLSKAKIKVTYEASDPATVARNGTSPDYEYVPASGKLRIWTKDGSVVRKPASIGAATPGDYVPNGTFAASKFGLTGSARAKTLYLEGISPSASIASSQIKIEVDPDGSGPADFVLVDAVRLTIIKIDLDARWNSNETTEEVPGTPVMLNDDWDGQKKYTNAAGTLPAPTGKRECEPCWDKDYTTAAVAGENDLMKVRISVAPATLTGNVVLKIPSGGTRIRLWPSASKGVATDVVTIPAAGKTYNISTLHKDIYVEGITLGQTEMTLAYTFGTAIYTDKLNIDVVTLIEKQGTTRKIINAYNSNIAFEVQPSTLSAKYKYFWDLNGDGNRNSGAWENGTARTATVKYSAAASGAGNVQLVRNAANRRKTYNVSVKLKGGELKGGLVLQKTIRVALDKHEGTALTGGNTNAGRDGEVNTVFAGWNNNNPIAFDNTGAPGTTQAQYQTAHGAAGYTLRVINNNNRMLYSATTGANGLCSFTGAAATLKIYVCFCGGSIWTNSQTREDMVASGNHEGLHCEQLRKDKTNTPANNIYRLLDVHYGGITAGCVSFLEAETHLSELNDVNVGWFHAIGGGQGDIGLFYTRFWTQCVQVRYPALPAGATKTEARTFLQNLYKNIPFQEMKKSGYDYYVRPPQ